MTCEICKGKGYYHIDEVYPYFKQREFYVCPRCEAGKNFDESKLPRDYWLSHDYHVSFEERGIENIRDDV